MEYVTAIDETLMRSASATPWFTKIDSQKASQHQINLIEHRAILFDDPINFLGLGSAREINYLNFDTSIVELPNFTEFYTM